MTTLLASPPQQHQGAAAASVAMGSPADAGAWLARELHDGAVQRLTSMVVEIELLRRQTGLADLEPIQQSARDAVADLRQLLLSLHQEPNVDLRFVDSVREMLADLERTSGIGAHLAVHSWPEELPAQATHNLRRVIGEALTNVRRHSGAHRVTVTLQVVDEALAVTVSDDGRGMEDRDSIGGFGFRGMRERVLLLGGRLTMDSGLGRGTTIRCIVPQSW